MPSIEPEKLSIYAFGSKLLDANDLDPIYTLLWKAKFPREKLRKWLLSYWCFYHCGTASWIVDQSDYWKAMHTAAASKDYPRSPERRHFRAKNAVDSVTWLEARGIDKLFRPFKICKTLEQVMGWVKHWTGFGPWISFKVADMLERLDLCKIDFDSTSMFLFNSPKEGAELMWELNGKSIRTTNVQDWAVRTLLEYFGDQKAPPRLERLINAQEVETILCKWKSYMKGHYKIGEDVEGCKHALEFRQGKTSRQLLKAGRIGGLW